MDLPSTPRADADVTIVPPPPDAPPPAKGHNAKEFDKSFARSAAWTGLSKGASQLIGWLATFIVARLLTPDDYGLVGMATVFLGMVTLVSEFGLGITIVTLRELDRDQIAQLNSVAVLLGVIAFVLCAMAALPLGWFFESTTLPLIVLALGTAFPISGFRVVPNALLQRDLRFKLLAALEGTNVIVMAVSMMLLAWAGFRYWTLVIGAVLSAIVTTSLTMAYRPHPFRWPRWAALRDALTFTRHQLGGNLLWYFYSNADFVVAGRLLGKAQLGMYSMAWSTATSIPDKITTFITRIIPAYFAALQNEPAELKRYLFRLTELLSVVTFPVLIGLALVADDFIRLALTEKWMPAVGPLRLLAIYAALNATTPLLSRVLTVRGETRYLLWLGVVLAIVLPISFAIGSRWGPTGIAAAWVIVFPLTRIPVFRRVSKSIGISAREYLLSFWPAMSGVIAMAASVLLVRALLPDGLPLTARLLIQVLVGAAVYVGVLLTWHRDRIEILLQLRTMWKRRRSQPATSP